MPLSPISPPNSRRFAAIGDLFQGPSGLNGRDSTLRSDAPAFVQLERPDPHSYYSRGFPAEPEPEFPPGLPRPGPSAPYMDPRGPVPVFNVRPEPRSPNRPLPEVPEVNPYVDASGTPPTASTGEETGAAEAAPGSMNLMQATNPEALVTSGPNNCACATKLVIDLTFLYQWMLLVWQSVQEFINIAEKVAAVKPFVTGYWEKEERKEYCLGPIPNPLPERHKGIYGDQIYVVTTEDTSILQYSLWPTLSVNQPLDDDDEWLGRTEYNVLWQPEPAHFPGQLQASEVCKAHLVIYALLVLSRALCFVIVQCATEILPIRPRASRIFETNFRIFSASPSPTEMHRRSGATSPCSAEDYKPLRKDLIRGPEALKAARRAGFRYRV
ncbi:hypothetical protein A7U60_g2284 [Sanghuangporus baumii]|uniref:Uncharacterized protein n=1 Tax=Sanghuangporus baumii TaxID=108892 RepID=A0A9Q5I2H2_SANBA|nr:hypothetical protein A7U60_g2284 [Sanghuangporus baumii]